MKHLLLFCLLFLFSASPLSSEVEGSTKKNIYHALCCELSEKPLPRKFFAHMHLFQRKAKESLLVMSYNMLSWVYDKKEKEKHHWKNRKLPIIQTIKHWQPDLIGTQELHPQQIEDILKELGKHYSCFLTKERSEQDQPVSVIFYKQERFSLIKGNFFNLPGKESDKTSRHFTLLNLYDKQADRSFYIANTHLAFASPDLRLRQTQSLVKQLQGIPEDSLILTGDFNTFPPRFEEELPAYDGQLVIQSIEKGLQLLDCKNLSLLGHFGPLSSTTYNKKTKENFSGFGIPSVFLDHIFVPKQSQVLFETSDPLKVKGEFPSDHLPVVAEILLPSS